MLDGPSIYFARRMTAGNIVEIPAQRGCECSSTATLRVVSTGKDRPPHPCNLLGITPCQRVMATRPLGATSLSRSPQFLRKRDAHVRFGDDFDTRADYGRPAVRGDGRGQSEIPPQVAGIANRLSRLRTTKCQPSGQAPASQSAGPPMLPSSVAGHAKETLGDRSRSACSP
jgi:hypothetical protein